MSLPRLPIAALCLSFLSAGCRDFSLESDQDLPPEISRVRTYPPAWAEGGAPVEAFLGQSFWIEGKNLTAGDTETPQVTVGGAQARILSSSDTRVQALVPGGLARGEAQKVVLSTSVDEVEADEELRVLGDGHLAGQGDQGRATMVSVPYSAAVGPSGVAYVDAVLGRLTALAREPEAPTRHLMGRGYAGDWGDVVLPVEVAAAPGGVFVRVAAQLEVAPQKHREGSAVTFVPEALLWPPRDSRVDPLFAVGCAALPPATCPEWGGAIPGRGAGKLAFSAALGGVFWLDLLEQGDGTTNVWLDFTAVAPPTYRVDLGSTYLLGYPLALAVQDPSGAKPGRLAIVTIKGVNECHVFDWTWTLAGGRYVFSATRDRTLPSAGACAPSDADFDASGRLAVVDARGALLRESGTGFETLELPASPPLTASSHSAYSVSAAADGTLLVGLSTGVVRVGAAAVAPPIPGADAGGLAPVEGFLPTTGAPSRLARSVASGNEAIAVIDRRDLLDTSAPLALLDARGPTLLAQGSPRYSLSKLAYLEDRGQLLSISLDLAQAVAGDLAYGLSAPVPEYAGWLFGFRGWASDGSRIGVASAGKITKDGPSGPSVAIFAPLPKGSDAGAAGGEVQVREISLPGGQREAMLGIATWGEDWVVAHRTKAQLVPGSGLGLVRTVAFTGPVSIPEQFEPRCAAGAGSCPLKAGFGALSPVASDVVRGTLFLPQASARPDLDRPVEAPALIEVSLQGQDAGETRWTMSLPDDRIVFDLSLSRRGDVLAVAASPIKTLLYERAGGFADAFVVVRGDDDAWKPWCRLGRDLVTAVAVSPDGTRLYAGVAGGRVYEVASFECPGPGRILRADPVPYAVLGDYYTAVTGLAPSQDGTRLGYLLQGRTATFGFLH